MNNGKGEIHFDASFSQDEFMTFLFQENVLLHGTVEMLMDVLSGVLA
jgi:hypothetical protein